MCGCSSINWIKNWRWLNSSGDIPESDLQLTDSFRDKPCNSASETFLFCVTTTGNLDLAVFYWGVRESSCLTVWVWARPAAFFQLRLWAVVWSQTHYLLQVSPWAVRRASSATSFKRSRCAVWRARLSPCLLTESLCYRCEPDSATFPAESLSCVRDEPSPVAYYSCWCILGCSDFEK